MKDGISEILSALSPEARNEFLDVAERLQHPLTKGPRRSEMDFNLLSNSDDTTIQAIIRKTDTRDLLIALKGAGGRVSEKFFKNLSQQGIEEMRKESTRLEVFCSSELDTRICRSRILRIHREVQETGTV